MEIVKYLLPVIVLIVIEFVFRFSKKVSKKDLAEEQKSVLPKSVTTSVSNEILPIKDQLKKVEHIADKKDFGKEIPYKIGDLIDLEQLEKIQDSLSKALGIASITVDNNGEPVTKESEFTNFCMSQTRKSVEGAKRCYQCDVDGGTLSAKTNKPAVYRCHAGLVDFAVPILIDGIQIGSIIGGQVLTSAPNEEKFRKVAREIGVNEEEYITELHKIPIVSDDKVEAAAMVLFLIGNTLSELGHNRLKAKERAAKLSSKSIGLVEGTVQKTKSIVEQINTLRNVVEEQSAVVVEFSATIEQMMAALGNISTVATTKNTSSQKLLDLAKEGENAIKTTHNAVADMVKNSEQIIDFMRLIDDINARTSLLGMNASIEAAHAGDRGKGFAVVAGEIRKLAMSSSENATTVDTFLKENSLLASRLSEMSNNTEATYTIIESEIKEVLQSLEEIASSTIEMSNGSKEIVSGIENLRNISVSVSDSSANMEKMILGINTAMSEIKAMTEDFITALE